MKKLLFTSDWHIPNEDGDWLATLIRRIIPDIQPDTIVLGGDILTCAGISKFLRDPETPSLADERAIAVQWLGELRDAAPRAKIIYLEGNHEERLQKTLKEVPGLHGLEELTIPRLLSLDSLGAEWIEYDQSVNVGPINCRHGRRYSKRPVYLATNLYPEMSGSFIFGHLHRSGHVVFYRQGQEHFGIAAPCGCSWIKEGYLHADPGWHRGAVLAHYGEDWARGGLIQWGFDASHGFRAICGAQSWDGAQHVTAPRGDCADRIMGLLRMGPQRTDEMIAALGVPKSTMRAAIGRLKGRGLIKCVGVERRSRTRPEGKRWAVAS